MKKINYILILLGIIGLNSFAQAENNTLVDRLNASSVKIEKKVGARYFPICTGVVLENQDTGFLVVTARHCLRTGRVFVEGNPVLKTFVSGSSDTAVLIGTQRLPMKFPVFISNKEVKINDMVYAYGLPDAKPHFTVGTVKNTNIFAVVEWEENYVYAESNLIYSKLVVVSGCSGGGLFNTNLELVGINIGTGRDFSTAVPIKSVERMLQQLLEFYNKS